MDIEKLKRWHWTVIGLLVGLLLGWGVKSLNESGGLTDAGTIGIRDFEQELLENNRGYPVLRDVVVHRSDANWTVTLRRLEVDPREKYPHNARHYHYVAKRLDARTPYVPTDPNETVEVRIDPSAERMDANSGKDFWTLSVNGQKVMNWPSRLTLDGWESSPNHWSNPGPGATIDLALRPASYQMTVVLDSTQPGDSPLAQLKVSLNEHSLPALTSVGSSTGAAWRTTIPRDAFVPGERQVLKFAGGGRPMRIREIRLLDPSYTVLDYLASVRQRHPQVGYRVAWWEKPAILYAMWAAGGMIVVGGIWPMLLRLLVGAGFGREFPPEEQYDLSRFKGEPERSSAPPAMVHEPIDLEQLEALEQELRRSLAAQASASDQPTTEPRPVAPLNGTVSDVPLAQTEEHKEYQGEYYPVVRKGAEHHE